MNRITTSERNIIRRLAPVLATGALVVLAACGDDSAATDQPTDTAGTIASPDTSSTVPATTAGGVAGFEHPTGTDDVVVEIIYEGGLVPADFAFRNLPTLLVSGGGTQFVLGPQIEIYPGPMLPNVLTSDIGEEGVQTLLELAADHGLLTHKEYERNDMVADAADTVVRVYANGEVYEHRAYALGMGTSPESDGTETGDRAELQAFVEAATSQMPMDGTPFAPETFLLMATPIDDAIVADIELSTTVDWTVDTVALADAAECLAVPAADVQELFAGSNQATYFTDGDVTYQVAAKPQLPGDSC
ncbi:MAG TPA: hypothetical protein VMM60_12865 [Ilumatobacter sp.]|nr:hypothetical protein [Ilumatobacter sp.]